MQAVASKFRMEALIASEAGQKASRKAQLTRQLQERRMQTNLKGRELMGLAKQIEIQQKWLELNAKETAIAKMEIEHAHETEMCYLSKYTNQELYAWMENSIRMIHYDLYQLALDLGKRAEKAFRFERGAAGPMTFLQSGGYWDNSRDGLLGAHQLHLDLRKMESAYLERPNFDFEIIKNISRRQIDPLQLLILRETGSTTFSAPELLFDFDFPGHYMRRIKSVSISIPCCFHR